MSWLDERFGLEGKTVVIVSHEPGLRSYARREVRIADGRITADEILCGSGGPGGEPLPAGPAAAGKEE